MSAYFVVKPKTEKNTDNTGAKNTASCKEINKKQKQKISKINLAKKVK